MTCGWQRRLYGILHPIIIHQVGRGIALPASNSRYAVRPQDLAGMPAHFVHAVVERRITALRGIHDIAPTTTLPSNRRSAMKNPCNASAVEICVPLISARPSLASSTTDAMPTAASAFVPA